MIHDENAIGHVMARVDDRRVIAADDDERGRVVACMERAVRRSGWIACACVPMANRLHLVVKTPRANLARA
ncbi:hypothetical protein [Aquisphaera giovannonii]|uniref:hypothetical protein n=1 Tax=Aquisphaera giovannonii TaxID=406548 RepID=UPI001AEF6CA0|nr:hypothetical protein [Aquisphaera giovannonii]